MGEAVKRAFYAQRRTGVLRLQHVSTRGSPETKNPSCQSLTWRGVSPGFLFSLSSSIRLKK